MRGPYVVRWQVSIAGSGYRKRGWIGLCVQSNAGTNAMSLHEREEHFADKIFTFWFFKKLFIYITYLPTADVHFVIYNKCRVMRSLALLSFRTVLFSRELSYGSILLTMLSPGPRGPWMYLVSLLTCRFPFFSFPLLPHSSFLSLTCFLRQGLTACIKPVFMLCFYFPNGEL